MMQDLLASAASAMGCGNYDGAVCQLDKATELLAAAAAAASPADATMHGLRATCYSQRAACYREVGKPQAAITDLGRAIAALQTPDGAAAPPLLQSQVKQADAKTLSRLLTARGVLLEQTEQHGLSVADFEAALQVDASNNVALLAAARLRAVLRGQHSTSGSNIKCNQETVGWRSVPRPGMRAFEHRGKAGAAF